MVLAYFPRTASFNPPTAFRSLPAALSVLPSVSIFLSPKNLPGGFFHGTFGLLCQHRPHAKTNTEPNCSFEKL
jgi:hypothetical protein